MNDTTLPISKKSNPRSNRPKSKVRKGFGLHDWMNLIRHAKDLAQRRGAPIRRDITPQEVKLHNKPYDGWMILRGKVYNVTPYMAYHPGGDKILVPCLGKDATVLFDKYHSWVNLDGLIGALLLGYVKVEAMRALTEEEEEEEERLSSDNTMNGNNDIVMPAASMTTTTNLDSLGFAMPKPRPPRGKPIASLLPMVNMEDESEDDAMQL